MTATTSFDPQAGYLVTASPAFTNFNQETLVRFYQPILGAAAFSILGALQNELHPQPTSSDRQLQSNLLAQLNIGSQEIITGLHRLEATGLVQTYFQHDQLGDLYVYELQPTLTPEQFLNDNLLSILLLEQVGEEAFKKLIVTSRRFQLTSKSKQLTNISHHFFDEFHVDSRSIGQPPAVINEARRTAQVEQQLKLTDNQEADFDWAGLLGMLASQPLIKADIEEQQELILVEHRLYGIDVPTMQKLILRAIDLESNHFNANKFKQLVAANYNVVYTDNKDRVAEEKTSSSDKTQPGITDKDRQLLKIAETYSPIKFLQILKGQTGGGYVTSSERHLLTRLVNDGKLSSEVINILSWYIIVGHQSANLITNLVDAIANNWIRSGINSGEAALLKLKSSQQSTGKHLNNYRRKRRQTIKEPMPGWTKKDEKELTKQASDEEVAKLKARLANRQKNKE